MKILQASIWMLDLRVKERLSDCLQWIIDGQITGNAEESYSFFDFSITYLLLVFMMILIIFSYIRKRSYDYVLLQIFTTTHNTDLMSNDLLRPDCYFLLKDNKIKAISDLTEKELRQAHNLQKMYKAGAFNW